MADFRSLFFPHSLRNRLSSIFRSAFGQLGAPESFGDVVPSQKPELGDFQCNGSMPAAKTLRKNPRQIAEQIIELVGGDPSIRDLSIAGPGFINFRVSNGLLAEMLEQAREDERLALEKVETPEKIVLDFGGPNVAKPMHVGHLRSSIIGDSLQRLFHFLGDEVLSDIHLGDWGTQMGMLIEAVRREQPALSYFDPGFTGPYPEESPVSIDDLQRLYPEASARCKGDEEELALAQQATAELQGGRPGYLALWKHFVHVSIQELRRDFDRLGVEFTHWFGESYYHDSLGPMVADLREKGIAVEDQGALIIPVAREDDKKEIPPLMLVKRDGGYLYATTDLATIKQRTEEFHADACLYIVDKRQGLHFEQVFRAARKSGIAGSEASLEHLAFGTMNGPDGKPFKTRAGGVMRLSDLMELMTSEAMKRMVENGIAEEYDDDTRQEIARRVGLASLKYADLQNQRTSDYIFDPEKFTRFEGRTGAYLCYAAVRIKSILRNAEGKELAPGAILPARENAERALQIQMLALPDALALAAETRMPHHLCIYAFDLAQVFNQFYKQCHILSESDPERQAAWLGLVSHTLRTMELVLGLLGIEPPERM